MSQDKVDETIQNRMMPLIKIDTSKQLADNFTKPLAYEKFTGCVFDRSAV
jgi:hypothetical protein